jgi:hypothetical protein
MVKDTGLLTIPSLLTVRDPLVVPAEMTAWTCVSVQHAYHGF